MTKKQSHIQKIMLREREREGEGEGEGQEKGIEGVR